MDEPLKPPAGLRVPGTRLWADVATRYMLSAGELEVLRQAAHTCDEVDRLEREVRRSPLPVPGSMGQLRPNPLLKVLHDHRLLLRRLVDSLNLPDESESSGLHPGARHAQKAANVRWRDRNSWHAARGASA
jgi:hypothetical protein